MDIKELFLKDDELVEILKIIAALKLKDSWLAAGTLRNYIWNILSGKPGLSDASDIDVVFFAPEITYEKTQAIQEQLQAAYPSYQWEVKNQVFMHGHSPHTAPYQNARDAISKYPERCTAIAARLKDGDLELFLPYDEDDIVNFIVQPTPHFLADEERMAVYHERLKKKDWQEKWPCLKIFI